MELNYENREQFTKITDKGELIIDDRITIINSNTFASKLTSFFDAYITGDDFIHKGNQDVKKVKIPENVTSIYEGVFQNFENLEEVILHENLERIGDNLFRGCKKLKNINIPSNIKEIGEFAFCDCMQLESVELPETIEKICTGAFKGCSKLEKINFPKSLKHEDDAFAGCKEELIKSIPTYLKCDENGVMTKFYTEDIIGNTLKIPKGVKKIESLKGHDDYYYKSFNFEFSDNPKIERIEFPDTLTSIGNNVINKFKDLKEVIMSDSIIELGKGNFYDCGNLEKVRLSRKLQNISADVIEQLQYTKVRCLILPDSIQDITGKFGSSYHMSHTEKNKDSITYYNKKHIPNEIIYKSEENGSSQEISVTQDETIKYYSLKGENSKQSEINKNTNKSIDMSDIKDLDKIVKLVISSDNINKIGPFAVSQCPNLEEVIIEEGIKEIGTGAFAECEKLKKVSFPKSLEKVSDYAFFNCPDLKDIKIDSKKLTIGDFSFAQCDSLQHAILPEKVDIVGKGAFYDCDDLKYVTGMKDVEKIDDFAFAHCSQLKISIPNKIKEIGHGAYCGAGTENWKYTDIEENDLVEYPFNETIIIIPSTLEKIGDIAFQGCTGITQAHFNQESKLKAIPKSAFKDCNLMSFIEIPDGLQKIDDNAFENCKLLEEVYMPTSISEIGYKSFSGCESLKLAMFKGSKKGEEISKSDSFDGCKNLKIVNFADLEFTLKRIDGEIYEVARKEKEKFSLAGIKSAIQKRKSKER